MANAIVTQRDTQLERQRAGYIQLSLTNFTNDDEPTIAAGSVVEISGTLYSVTGNESITGWAGVSNGPVWIKLVPDGTEPFTAEYTDVAPTWFDAKQGWYDGTGTDRYVAGLTKTGASGYAQKYVFDTLIRGHIEYDSNRTVLGNEAVASTDNSVSIGAGANASGDRSISIGHDVSTTRVDEFAIGKYMRGVMLPSGHTQDHAFQYFSQFMPENTDRGCMGYVGSFNAIVQAERGTGNIDFKNIAGSTVYQAISGSGGTVMADVVVIFPTL